MLCGSTLPTVCQQKRDVTILVWNQASVTQAWESGIYEQYYRNTSSAITSLVQIISERVEGGVKGTFSPPKTGNMFDRIVKHIMIVHHNLICAVRSFVL